jgi:mannose-6-phosphate isomerase-like protein (cupin superfamily)
VVTLIDLSAELAKLKMLQGRTPQTTRAEREGSATQVAPYRDGHIFASKFAGSGAWERHPNGDELVHVIDGAATLHLAMPDGLKSCTISAGMIAVVPQGIWHRFDAPDGVTLMTATPQPSEHPAVHVEDPRSLG